MGDDSRNDERDQARRSEREGGSPEEGEPIPGDPREAQEPQEPRSTHVGRTGGDLAAVEQLREDWDKRRGK
jgi:hypothetical protein